MRGGQALEDLISGLLEHAEMEALLEEVKNRSGQRAADHSSQ